MGRKGLTLIEFLVVISILTVMAALICPRIYDSWQRHKEAASQPALRIGELLNFNHLTKAESFDDEYHVVKFATNATRITYSGEIYTTQPIYEWLHLDNEAYYYLKARKGQNVQTIIGYWKTELDRQKNNAGAAEK